MIEVDNMKNSNKKSALSHTAYYLTENIILETYPSNCNEFIKKNDQIITYYCYIYGDTKTLHGIIQEDMLDKISKKLNIAFLDNNIDSYLKLYRAIEDVILANKCVYIFSEEHEIDKLCILAVYLQSKFKSSENIYKDIFEIFKITDPKRIDSIKKNVLIYIYIIFITIL